MNLRTGFLTLKFFLFFLDEDDLPRPLPLDLDELLLFSGVYTNSTSSFRLTPILVLNEALDFTLAVESVSIIFKFQF